MCAPDVDTEATPELFFRVPVEVAALFIGVRETLRERLRAQWGRGRRPTDGEVFDALLDRALVAWTRRDPKAKRPDPVMERDGYRCVVPGCTSRRNLHGHHVVFRSHGGSEDPRNHPRNHPRNRAALCAFHPQRCLHPGLLRVRGRAPDRLVFEIGRRPGGEPLARYRSGDVLHERLGAPREEDMSRAV